MPFGFSAAGMGAMLRRPETQEFIQGAIEKKISPILDLAEEGTEQSRTSLRDSTQQLSNLEDIANRKGLRDAVAESVGRAGRASDRDRAQFERATAGLDLSARQKRAAGKRFSLSRALNRASAAGGTRRGFTDRAKYAKAAGGGFADALRTQRFNVMTDLGAATAGELAADAAERASDRASRLGLIGTGLGLLTGAGG